MLTRPKTRVRSKKKFLSLKKIGDNYLYILLWIGVIAIIYSTIYFNFFNQEIQLEKEIEKHNKEKIDELGLDQLFNKKNETRMKIKIEVRNNSDIDNLAARIADCLQKNDYEITDQNNFPNEGRDQRLTKIIVHWDMINNPKAKKYLKDFKEFTGYDENMFEYIKNEDENNLTIILGTDWDSQGNLRTICPEIPIN